MMLRKSEIQATVFIGNLSKIYCSFHVPFTEDCSLFESAGNEDFRSFFFVLFFFVTECTKQIYKVHFSMNLAMLPI